MTDGIYRYFDQTISRDFFHLWCGEKLGEGVAREVYECNFDPSLVVKIETAAQSFQNTFEWKFWEDNRYCPEIAQWLAPCVKISPCGIILLQKRTKPLKKFPESVPDFATDIKPSNWGSYRGRPVMHDYGLVCYHVKDRMKKVKRW